MNGWPAKGPPGVSLNESLPHKRKRHPALCLEEATIEASMKVFRISGRDLDEPHRRLAVLLSLNESLPHKRKRRPPNFSSFELLKLRASRA